MSEVVPGEMKFLAHGYSATQICLTLKPELLSVCCAQSCPTLCDPTDYSSPGFPVHGISQARTLEWVAMPSSKIFSPPRDQTCVSCISCTGRQVLYNSRHLGSPHTTLDLSQKAKKRWDSWVKKIFQITWQWHTFAVSWDVLWFSFKVSSSPDSLCLETVFPEWGLHTIDTVFPASHKWAPGLVGLRGVHSPSPAFRSTGDWFQSLLPSSHGWCFLFF